MTATSHTVGGLPQRVSRFELPGELRAALDFMNDNGVQCTIVGRDARGVAFLIELAGVYAETEAVVFGNPFDPEVSGPSGTHCDDCGAHATSGMDKLVFPVVVL